MKIKTALTTILICTLFLFNCGKVFAETSFEGTGGDVSVNAKITEDLYSQLEINPANVEILQPTTVNLEMLDSQNNPMFGRSLVIYINGSSTGVTITQPNPSGIDGKTSGTVKSSIPGTYEVCARDTTDGFNIYILDCETVYIVPVAVPTLLSEPQYTKGLENTLSWTTSGSGTYTYTVQASTSSTFSNISKDSGWISSSSYNFAGLSDGQIYFYRVKAKNAFGAESNWSNLVYSVQDNTKPEITFLSVSGLGSNTTKDWDSQTVVTFKLRVKDNIGVTDKSFWCVLRDDSSKDCLSTESMSGNIWSVNVKLGDLEHDSDYHLYSNYKFCAEASDSVGNIRRICNIELDVPSTTTPVKPVPPVIEKIKDAVNNAVENTKELANNTIGKINQTSLQQISVTVTVGNLLVGMGILLGGLGTIPYVILQIFLALSSLFGFRKKGHPTGYVYDSVTKEPISQCIVRIFNEGNELIWTDVTDRDGYFRSDKVSQGEYSIRVMSKDYDFPSKIVFGKTDFPLENVYGGQEFYVSKDSIPNFSIPMDSKKMSEFKRVFSQLAFGSKVLWKFLHLLLFVLGLIFSIYALSTNMVWYNYVIVGLYIPSILLVVFALFGRGDRYGVVRDVRGKRLVGITLGLKEVEFGRLVSKRVSDDNGRYRFFVNVGVYELVVLSPGWVFVDEGSVSNIRFKKEGVLIRNIVLKRVVSEKRVKKVKVEEVLEPLEEL